MSPSLHAAASPPPRAARHPTLCEACGYEIAGLPGGANCSECGRPVALSHPDRRAGSPWQRAPSLRTLLATNYRAIRDATSLYDSVRIDVASGAGLMLLNMGIAAALLVAPWSGVLIGDPVRAAPIGGRPLVALWAVPPQIVFVMAVLMALTMVEWIGIRAFARSRGWRLTRAAAWQVCAHASVGWVITGVTSWLGLIVSLNLAASGAAPAGAAWVAPAAGALLGLLIFELLVWKGLQRCRFANSPLRAVASR